MDAFAGHEVLPLDLPCYDVTDPGVVECAVDFRPELIVHAAAYTDVDGAEKEPDLAYRVNAFGVQNMALAAQRTGAALMYVSTNEVFDGTRRDVYREWDKPSPVSVYASSKAAGEQIVRELLSRFYIVRVAWLFGPGGTNFVTKILATAAKHGSLRVSVDEFGNPTYAPDAANAMARLAETGHFGTYHLTNSGYCSRYQFAVEIMRLAGREDVPVTPILSAEWPRPSKPPLHALLANTAAAALGLSLRPWQEALADYMVTLQMAA